MNTCSLVVAGVVVLALALAGALLRIFKLKNKMEEQHLLLCDMKLRAQELEKHLRIFRKTVIPQCLVDERLSFLVREVERRKESVEAEDTIDAEARLGFWEKRFAAARAAARALGYRVKSSTK
ncbi:hypothetical protein D6779_10295 [Candidatus Parcubacteria bacterium]|nr:MAG: hypothetical protein D6779_10295 [Candidatus Parcubacteria bacterium]